MSLIANIALQDTQIARKYIFLCAGCALIQLAHLECPSPIRPNRALNFSHFEIAYPNAYASVFIGLKVLALISVVVELWVGFHLLNWKSVLFVFVGTTFGVDLLFPKLLWLITGAVGLTLSIAALFIIFM
jgi:hypothetical protein